jgi:hypothetical protein
MATETQSPEKAIEQVGLALQTGNFLALDRLADEMASWGLEAAAEQLRNFGLNSDGSWADPW